MTLAGAIISTIALFALVLALGVFDEEKGKAKRWNALFAESLFQSQKKNPHIGRVANVYMVLAALDIHIEWMYAMEDMVDACMGSPYEPAFDEIEAWIQYGWELVRQHGKVDRFFAGGWKAKGASNKEIARGLNLAESTVKIHVQNILKKLNLSSRVQAAVYAVEHGLNLPMSDS